MKNVNHSLGFPPHGFRLLCKKRFHKDMVALKDTFLRMECYYLFTTKITYGAVCFPLIAFLHRIFGANDDLLAFNYTLIFTLSKINE